MRDGLPENLCVVVTGGGGFVGAGLTRALLACGATVTAVDNGSFERLADLADCPNLRRLTVDVRDAEAVDAAIVGSQLVLHLAAIVGVQRYLADPLAVIDVNLNGTRQVAAACTRHGAALVFVSTSEVYGSSACDLREDGPIQLGNLHSPRWSYALSKASAEQVVLAHSRAGMRGLVVRFFNVYGPLIDEPGQGRVISQFLGAIAAGRPLSLVDGGSAIRSFCFIDDAVAATLRLAARLLADVAVSGQIINVGRREPVSMAELAEHFVRLTGRGVTVEVVSGESHFGVGFEEIQRRVPNLDRLRQWADFEAPTSLEVGLRRTLHHWGLLSPAARPAPDRLIPFVQPQLNPSAQLLNRLAHSLTTGRLANGGPWQSELERSLTRGAPDVHAVAVSSGYAALVLALSVACPADRTRTAVVLPAFTFAATRNAVLAAGMQPVFADIDPSTWTLSPASVARVAAGRTDIAAIVAVNVFGVPPQLRQLRDLARSVGCVLVLDDAHGMGTTTEDSDYSTHWAAARALSFHATKTVPAGEGGAVLFQNKSLADEARILANHGIGPSGVVRANAWNFKMSELPAAVAVHSLQQLPEKLPKRRATAQHIRTIAQDCGRFQVQRVPEGVESSFQNLGLLVRGLPAASEAELGRLHAAQIEARRYFSPQLSALENGHLSKDLPVTSYVAARVLCLPLHDAMDPADVARIGACLGPVQNQVDFAHLPIAC